MNPGQGKPPGGHGEVRQNSKQKRRRQDVLQGVPKVQNSPNFQALVSSLKGKEPTPSPAPSPHQEVTISNPSSHDQRIPPAGQGPGFEGPMPDTIKGYGPARETHRADFGATSNVSSSSKAMIQGGGDEAMETESIPPH